MKTSKLWKGYVGNRVRLIIKDVFFEHGGNVSDTIKTREGIFKDIDNSHIFLQLDGREIATPFIREDIKRVEIKENGRQGKY